MPDLPMTTGNPVLTAELKARRLWLVIGWTLVLLIIYLSLTPTPIELPLEQGDKLSHAFAYLVVMSWFANLYDALPQRVGIAIGLVLLGVALEFVQRCTGYRSFEVTDMAASATGVILGWVLAPPRLPNYLQFVEKVCKAKGNISRR
jgi:VanZ family protein